jgi:hypothetical protein
MGIALGERLMGQPERRAEAIPGEFNSQSIPNTPWAFAKIGTKPGERMMEHRSHAIFLQMPCMIIREIYANCPTHGSVPGSR